jgi:acyl-CoA thioester hydrolase
MTPEPFSHVQRVAFRDIDALGHANNVELLRFVEAARIAYMQHLQPGYSPVERPTEGWILAETRISYRSPAYFDDVLRTTIHPGELSRSSVRLPFEIRGEEDGRLVAEGNNTVVSYDHRAGRSRPIPDAMRRRLESGV